MKMNPRICGLCVAVTVLAVTVLAFPGCRKRTPVEEVSVGQSGLEVVARDLSSLKSAWPQWRGPEGNARAADQPLPTTWGRQENVKWRVEVAGRGHSSPIVVDGKVIVATAIEKAEKQMVLAFDEQTGVPVWETVIHDGNFPSPNEVHRKATNANSTLASDGSLLVTTFFNNDRIFVTALSLDGSQVWQTDIGAFNSKFGYAPSPIIYKSFVIVAADNFGGGYLVALDLASGDVAWRRARGDASSYSSPTVATVGGVDQVLISGGDRVASYDPATGDVLWETKCISEATCGTIVTTDKLIFASGGYPDKETVCLSETGKMLWGNRTKIYEPSMVTDGKHLFGVTDNGIAMCWDNESGSQLWRERLGGNFSSSPVLCNGHLYVIDLAGRCHVFEASGEAFQSVATNPIADDGYASPAIAGGCLFFRVGIGKDKDRREELVCIGDPESGEASPANDAATL